MIGGGYFQFGGIRFLYLLSDESGRGRLIKREKLSMIREEGWHHEIFVPDPVYRVRDFF